MTTITHPRNYANNSGVTAPMAIPPPPNAFIQPLPSPSRTPNQYKVNLAEEEDPADYKPGGYYPVHIMDSFSNNRYLVLRKMGWGHFSTVWLAKDNVDNRHVALKVMKSSRRYTETALDEIKLLQTVKSANPSHSGYSHLVSFLDSFQHPGLHDQPHVCMTFEPLGENLLSLTQRCVKENKMAAAALGKRRLPGSSATKLDAATSKCLENIELAVPKTIVKTIAKQVLLGLDYLHTECRLVHTDLKPENILIALPDVEEVVRMELLAIPTSESIKASTRTIIGFPPGYNRNKSPSSLHNNQVYIFSSQPLSSPSRTPISSLQNSPMDRLTMRMSALYMNSSTNSNSSSTTTPANPNAISATTETPSRTSRMHGHSASGSGSTFVVGTPPKLGSGVALTATAHTTVSGVVTSAKSLAASSSAHGSTSKTTSATVIDLNPSPTTSSSGSSESLTSLAGGLPVNGGVAGLDTPEGSLTYTSPASSYTYVMQSVLQKAGSGSGSGKSETSADGTEVMARGDTPIAFGALKGNAVAQNGSWVGPSLLSKTAPPKSQQQPAIVVQQQTTPPVLADDPLTREQSQRCLAIPSFDAAPPAPISMLGNSSNATTIKQEVVASAHESAPLPTPLLQVKIADLGNATPIDKKFTNDIQTRQYRSPEAILGMYEWDERVDIFSVACVVFELLTGEYLFNPKTRQQFSKDDDHVAQIMELMGDGFSKAMKTEGKYSREIFRSNGSLRNIHKLHFWPLSSVMVDKYDWDPEEAKLFASFMEPMLQTDPKKRAYAKDLIDHPWLDVKL
ncbi:serine/threonine protein kinase, CMGC group [Tulasnella sp. 419]|nr:serine/threonine protein kinase, CMGC group [Tulasnella sp. 419]